MIKYTGYYNMIKQYLLLLFSSAFLYAQPDSVVTIEINSNYKNAAIFVDDLKTSYATPSEIPNIRIGNHKITLRWKDLLNNSEYIAEEFIDVKDKETNRFQIDFKPVSVTLVCNAEQTQLYLNGSLKGEGGDLVIDRIIPGTYNLRLKQNFGMMAEKQVYFPPNSSDCPPECFIFGNLHVVSEEIDNVPIYINGIKTDRLLPAKFNNLIIGEYEVSAEVHGKLISKRVVVKKDEENYIHINPKQIAKEIKEQELAHEAFLKQERALQKEKERTETELRKSQEALKPKEKLPFLVGITAGLNGSYIAKLTGKKTINYGRLTYGGFVCIPVLDLLYVQNEVRYFPKKYDGEFSPNWSVKRYVSDISYLYDFLLLRKDFHSGVYCVGGVGFGLTLKSKKILYETVNDTPHYTNDKSSDVAWALGFGFDPSHDFSIEVRFARSISRFKPAHTDINVRPKTISLNAGYYLNINSIYKKVKKIF
ncbi:WVD2 family protein [bacterium]|nr:WVD2 family protein [bacterium]